jgi:mono/diheme cytochrome c family protein
MMKSLLALVLVVSACGGGSKPPPQEPAPQDPVPMDPVARPDEPTPAPEEPVKPEEPKPDPKVELLALETAAFDKAKPVFDKWCAKCHTADGKNTSAKKRKELDITAYPFTGEHANAKDIRKTLGIGGGKPSMPADKKGAVKGDELALIAAWADAWDASHAGGAHEGHAGH